MGQSPLDELAERIARIGRKGSDTAIHSTPSSRDSETSRLTSLVDQAIAAMDENLRRQEDKTASALDGVAKWMEQNDATRSANARLYAESRVNQETALAKTMSLLVNRLDEIDAKISTQSGSASDAARNSIARIEARLDTLGKMGRDVKFEEASNSPLAKLETRLGDLTKKLDHLESKSAEPEVDARYPTPRQEASRRNTAGRASNDLRSSLARGDLSEALAGIAARQKDLDSNPTKRRLQALGARLDQRQSFASGNDVSVFDELKEQVSAIRQKLEAQPAPTEDMGLRTLRSDLQSISAAIQDAAPRQQLSSIESAIQELTQKFSAIDASASDHADLQSLEDKLAAVKSMLETSRDSDRLNDIAQDIRLLKLKMDGVRDRAVDPGLMHNLTQQTTEIRDFISRTAQSSTGLEALEQRISGLASQIERSISSNPGEEKQALNEISQRLDRLQAGLASTPASLVNLSPLEQMVRDLSAKIETGMGRDHKSPDLEAAIRSLENKLDRVGMPNASVSSAQAQNNAHIEELMRNMAAKLDAAEMLGAPSERDIARIVKALEDKIDAVQSSSQSNSAVNHEFEKLVRSIEQKVDGIQKQGSSSSQIDTMMKELAARMDRAQAPGASDAAFDSLQQQVALLSTRLEKTDDHFATLGSLEKTIGDIFSQLDSVRHASMDAAETAARNAVRDAMVELQPVTQSHSENINHLVREFSSVKSAQDITDRRTQETLEAVHDTLEKIVERLAMLENEMVAQSRHSARPDLMDAAPRRSKVQVSNVQETNLQSPILQAPGFSMPVNAPVAAAMPNIEKGNIEPAPNPASMFKAPEEPAVLAIRKPEPEVELNEPLAGLSQMDTGEKPLFAPRGAPLRQPVPEAVVEKTIDFVEAPKPKTMPRFSTGADPDLPLEPGAGRPDHAATPKTATQAIPEAAKPQSVDAVQDPERRMQDAKASFIAAARRAAQAAADQSAVVIGKDGSHNGHLDESASAGSRAKVADRVRSMAGNYRRPVLLGLAAVVLAGGGLGYYKTRPASLKTADSLSGSLTNQAVTKIAPALDTTEKPALGQRSDAGAPASQIVGSEPASAVLSDSKAQDQAKIQDQKASSTTIKTKPAKVSDATPATENTPGSVDPMQVGAIPQRQLPTLAQPLTANGTSMGRALPGTKAPTVKLDELTALAESGDARAQYELGTRYIDGVSVARDPKLATQWLEKAAAQGLAPAQYRLGSLYRDGKGLRNDSKLAYEWFRRAAEQGNARAMHNLGVVLAEGITGTPDYSGAADWFRKAAEYGVKDSQFNIAILYARGLGMEVDLVQSYKWFSAAADSGDPDAAKKRDEVAAKLPPEQLAEAKAAALNYRPKALDAKANDVAPVASIPQIPANKPRQASPKV